MRVPDAAAPGRRTGEAARAPQGAPVAFLHSSHGRARRTGRRRDQRHLGEARRASRGSREGHPPERDLHALGLRAHHRRAHAVGAGPRHRPVLQRRRGPGHPGLRAGGPWPGAQVLSAGRIEDRRGRALAPVLLRPDAGGLPRLHACPQARPGDGPAGHGEGRRLVRRAPGGGAGHPGRLSARAAGELRHCGLQLDPLLQVDGSGRHGALGPLPLRAGGRRALAVGGGRQGARPRLPPRGDRGPRHRRLPPARRHRRRRRRRERPDRRVARGARAGRGRAASSLRDPTPSASRATTSSCSTRRA